MYSRLIDSWLNMCNLKINYTTWWGNKGQSWWVELLVKRRRLFVTSAAKCVAISVVLAPKGKPSVLCATRNVDKSRPFQTTTQSSCDIIFWSMLQWTLRRKLDVEAFARVRDFGFGPCPVSDPVIRCHNAIVPQRRLETGESIEWMCKQKYSILCNAM